MKKTTVTKKMVGTAVLITLAFAGCGNKEVSNQEKAIDLGQCIVDARDDFENSLYPVLTDKEDLGTMGIDEELVKNSAISLTPDGKAYCLAVIKTDSPDEITEQMDKYSKQRAEEMYKQYYDESLIAEDYTIRYFEDYVIFAMCDNAETACGELENSVILAHAEATRVNEPVDNNTGDVESKSDLELDLVETETQSQSQGE